jgi:hypothetical protein
MAYAVWATEGRVSGERAGRAQRVPGVPQVREAGPHYSVPRDSAESLPSAPHDSPHLDDLAELAGLNDDDFNHELGRRIVRLAAHSGALEYRLLILIGEFDRRRIWASEGYRDCAAWLEMHTGMSRITARALVRVATPDNEAELLPMAYECTAGRLEKEVAHYRELAEWGHLDAAGDALFHGNVEWSPEAGEWGLATEEVSPGQRRADALHLVLERAMVAGFGGVGGGQEDEDEASPPPALAPALSARAAADPVADLVRTHRFRGIDPHPWTGASRSQSSPASLLRFQEALDPPA